MNQPQENDLSFTDIYDIAVLKKVWNSFDQYLANADFKENIIDYILKDLTANEHQNYHKILRNLGVPEEGIEWQPHFLLGNCACFHTMDLLTRSPEKLTFNHKIALYAFDLFCDMEGDEEYPHETYSEQLAESLEMFAGGDQVEGSPSFIESAWEWVHKTHLKNYFDFLAVNPITLD